MRVIRCVLLLFALLILPARAQESDVDLAQQASALYVQGEYEAARNLLEALVAQGVHDSRVYFNLGQTYLRLNQPGWALVQFRRAQTLSPRDRDVNLGLARVRANRVDIEGDEIALPDSLTALTSGVLTIAEVNAMMLVLWTSFFLLVALFALRTRWHAALRGPLACTLLLLLIGFGLWVSRWYSTVYRPAAVVVETAVPVMSGPGSDYLEIYTLHAAAELRILEVRGEWARIILPEERQGWLPLRAIERVEARQIR
ncbi:MAG: hypothetical protein K8J31_00760 [Anaerolineae bacterium]|nr:hypothetical protein [Anaerolineae bacterium]